MKALLRTKQMLLIDDEDYYGNCWIVGLLDYLSYKIPNYVRVRAWKPDKCLSSHFILPGRAWSLIFLLTSPDT